MPPSSTPSINRRQLQKIHPPARPLHHRSATAHLSRHPRWCSAQAQVGPLILKQTNKKKTPAACRIVSKVLSKVLFTRPPAPCASAAPPRGRKHLPPWPRWRAPLPRSKIVEVPQKCSQKHLFFSSKNVLKCVLEIFAKSANIHPSGQISALRAFKIKSWKEYQYIKLPKEAMFFSQNLSSSFQAAVAS